MNWILDMAQKNVRLVNDHVIKIHMIVNWVYIREIIVNLVHI